MNDAEIKIKQQIVDKIKSSTNILITVSRDPSVDDLSAMLGLTAILNKLGKHATAIFSGSIPPAITFLDPDKVFENNANSLRDFIIALDKEKADHLRYKVEGNMVKIFITPYRTNITSDDLEFSQGNYNIELVLALGVVNRDHLDEALTAHGNVLENVAVVTFSTSEQSQLGNMDWNDKNAGCLSEMIALLGEAFKSEKPLLDKQIATALLTGIVAATDRFSNLHTTSRVMTTAAQLMAAGADQQLIAAKLQELHAISSLTVNPMDNGIEVPPAPAAIPEEPIIEQSTLPPSDNLVVSHEPEVTTITPEPATDTFQPAVSMLPQPELPESMASTLPPQDLITSSVSAIPQSSIEPSLGGTLNATTDQAAEDSRRELEDQQNKTILTHSYLSNPESMSNTPINSANQPEDNRVVDIFAGPSTSTLPPAEEQADRVVPLPVIQPPTLDMPLPPPLPDFSTLSPPPMFGSAAPSMPITELKIESRPIVNDPSQFRIPGQ